MAQRYPTAPQVVDPVENDINDTIDRLIGLLNVRRAELLDLTREKRVREKRAPESLRKEMIKQLTETQEQFHLDLRQNILQPYKIKSICELECKKRETILNTPIESLCELRCDTSELERCISRIGVIVESPRYATRHPSVVATGKKGSAPDEMIWPSGVAIHEETYQILVANRINQRVEIFSESGEFLSQMGVGQLSEPYGIAIHGDSVYVSCEDHTVSQFSLTKMCRVRRMGGRGSNNGRFNYPHQLTTDPIGRVFIADFFNNRICIHDPDLNHLRNIKHPSMSRLCDVKVSRDRLYVLCPNKNPCMLVLTLEGDKLHSLITCGRGMDVLDPRFFCLDSLNNFVLSDNGFHSIRVFSPEGNLLHTIGREGHQPGMFYKPHGVAITPNGRLVCVSQNENYGLQIFC